MNLPIPGRYELKDKQWILVEATDMSPISVIRRRYANAERDRLQAKIWKKESEERWLKEHPNFKPVDPLAEIKLRFSK